MKLISKIDQRVEGRGLTYKWIASQLDVTQATFSRWVHNKSHPSIHTLFRLAALLECTVDDLYEYSEE